MSSFFPVNKQGCVLSPSLFNTCMGTVLELLTKVMLKHLPAIQRLPISFFANDAVIFAKSLEVPAMALEILHKERQPLELNVSCPNTKVQMFGGFLDETVQSIHARGKDTEILKNFTYLVSVCSA